MRYLLVTAILACLMSRPLSGQATLTAASIPSTRVSSGYDGPSNQSMIGVIEIGAVNPDGSGAHVKFQVSPADFVEAECAKAVFLSPSSGTTPATVYAGINPGYWNGIGGTCQIYFTTVDQAATSKTYAILPVGISQPAVPIVTTVYGAADYLPVVSPGEIVSIFGSSLGQNAGALNYDVTGAYPLSLRTSPLQGQPPNTTVTFNGVAAPLLYVNPTQINAVVPYGVPTGSSVNVIVSRDGVTSVPFSVAVKDTSPSIFAVASGTGQAAILNVGPPTTNPAALTYNSINNPAAKGSYIEFFATGFGVWNPSVQDGSVNLFASNFTAKQVSVTIGGQAAPIYYVGSAPFQPWAMVQLIVIVPSGIASGQQPLLLTVGQNNNSKQNVTVAVQ